MITPCLCPVTVPSKVTLARGCHFLLVPFEKEFSRGDSFEKEPPSIVGWEGTVFRGRSSLALLEPSFYIFLYVFINIERETPK